MSSALPRRLWVAGSTPQPFSSSGEEAMVKVCGVAVAMLPEYSWAPPWLIDCR